MGTPNVWILGGYQSDFARNLTREGRDFADLTAEVVDNALTAAKVDASDIEVVHVGNAFGEMFARQGHLGAMPASVNDGLWDTPASRHEAACASGSVATLAALSDLRSGAYRTALVVGVELEKTVPGDIAAQHLGAAAWTDHEGAEATFMAVYVRPTGRRVRPPVRHRRRASASHRPTELRQRPPQSERADPRLDGARSAQRRRRQPADRGSVAPLRLQPDDRRRRGDRPCHRR